uniref:Uncharacterized protein n=1 Tax=Timema cristinae TaxID=61476 RepID=A0A7R9D4D8_TIMCR|nr:unnamed protein product [Timema cristinae]
MTMDLQTNKSDGLINAAFILRKSERIFLGDVVVRTTSNTPWPPVPSWREVFLGSVVVKTTPNTPWPPVPLWREDFSSVVLRATLAMTYMASRIPRERHARLHSNNLTRASTWHSLDMEATI